MTEIVKTASCHFSLVILLKTTSVKYYYTELHEEQRECTEKLKFNYFQLHTTSEEFL